MDTGVLLWFSIVPNLVPNKETGEILIVVHIEIPRDSNPIIENHVEGKLEMEWVLESFSGALLEVRRI